MTTGELPEGRAVEVAAGADPAAPTADSATPLLLLLLLLLQSVALGAHKAIKQTGHSPWSNNQQQARPQYSCDRGRMSTGQP